MKSPGKLIQDGCEDFDSRSTREAELNRLEAVDPGPMNNLTQGAGRPRGQSNRPAHEIVSSASHPERSGEEAGAFRQKSCRSRAQIRFR